MTMINTRGGVLLLICFAMVMSVILVVEPVAALGILVLPALIGAALLFRGILRNSKLAVYVLVFIAVFMVDATFRVRDYTDKGTDFQIVLKVLLWATMTGAALIHLPRWLPQVTLPTNIPVLMLFVWMLFTATLSPTPTYSIVAAYSLCAYMLFFAYVFANFDHVEVFAVTVLALTLFTVISIIVYFAVPEFGRFIYWLNEQRYISARLAGIAGSANNMGRLAAFGLILIMLYGREFRRYNRLFVPVSAVILAVALIMTNSRSSIAMVGALWAVFYLVNSRRAYLAVLGVSAIALAAIVIIPAGDEALKLIARNGGVDEVTSMTGRAGIWEAIPKLIESHRWTGFGYGSSVYVIPEHEREVGFVATHAHNLILQLLLTTGWVGVVLFSLSMLTVGLRSVYFAERTPLAMIALVLLNGLTESSAFTTVANICTLAFAIAVVLPSETNNYENDYSY